MPRHDTSRTVPRSEAVKAFGLAAELIAAAESAVEAGHWRAVGLNAIHAGIAAADAALIAGAGVRSASQDHGAVVQLLEQRVPSFEAANKRQLAGLLKEKNAIAYERASVSEVKARVMLDQARRLVAWAGALLQTGSS